MSNFFENKKATFNHDLLANILAYVMDTDFIPLQYDDTNTTDDELRLRTRRDIIRLANQLLPKETLADYFIPNLDESNNQ